MTNGRHQMCLSSWFNEALWKASYRGRRFFSLSLSKFSTYYFKMTILDLSANCFRPNQTEQQIHESNQTEKKKKGWNQENKEMKVKGCHSD